MAEPEYERSGRRMLLVATVLTVLGAIGFSSSSQRDGLSFVFGAVTSIALLALLFRTLGLLDFTGQKGNTAKSTQVLLAMGHVLVFGAVYGVLSRYEVSVNATAAGFSVGISAAILEQFQTLLRGK